MEIGIGFEEEGGDPSMGEEGEPMAEETMEEIGDLKRKNVDLRER